MRKAYLRLWEAAEVLDPVNKGRFNPGKENYTPFWDHESEKVRFNFLPHHKEIISVLPHFPTSNLCAQFIVENRDDLATVFSLPNS